MKSPGLHSISGLKLASGLLLVFLSGLIIGLFFGIKWRVQTYTEKQELRLADGYKFINPLLECEIAGEQVEFSELTPFKREINALIAKSRDQKFRHISVYFRDLNNGLWFGMSEKEPFAPASLLKVPTMIAMLKSAEQRPEILSKQLVYEGRTDLNEAEIYKPELKLEAGKSYSIDELLYRSISHSDNNANTMIFNEIEQELLVRTYKDLGLPVPTANAPENFMSVKQYASFFRILFNASYLSKEMSEKALSLLNRSTFRNGIVSGVPPGIQIAHKFGERISVTDPETIQMHDCGIIYYPGKPYLLCIMSRGKDFNALNEMISDISKAVFEEVDRQSRSRQAN